MKKILVPLISLLFLAGIVIGAAANGTQEAKPAALLTQAPANFKDLVTAAQKEGQLTVIALPHDWVNYGEAISTFSKKYGIKINELNPDGGSGDEIEAIKANKDNKGPQAPDVIDVGLSFGPDAKAAGLLSPYKVQTWSTIPDSVKDAEGAWYGDYYGALAFEVNLDVVKTPPQDWADLLQPAFKGQVALAGDPRTANQAIMAIGAAAIANGGSFDNAKPGLDYFDKLNKAGNFVPLIAVPGTVDSGETPVTMRWDYNALSNRDKSDGNPNIGVIIPASGVVAGVYVQAISAYAPHPNCAKLYEEFIMGDEGQTDFLRGYAHPARFASMVSRGVIAADVLSAIPSAAAYSVAVIPTLDQIAAANKVITTGWDKAVGANVK